MKSKEERKYAVMVWEGKKVKAEQMWRLISEMGCYADVDQHFLPGKSLHSYLEENLVWINEVLASHKAELAKLERSP